MNPEKQKRLIQSSRCEELFTSASELNDVIEILQEKALARAEISELQSLGDLEEYESAMVKLKEATIALRSLCARATKLP